MAFPKVKGAPKAQTKVKGATPGLKVGISGNGKKIGEKGTSGLKKLSMTAAHTDEVAGALKPLKKL